MTVSSLYLILVFMPQMGQKTQWESFPVSIGSSFAFEWGRLAGSETTITIKMTASLPENKLDKLYSEYLITDTIWV